LQHIAFVMSPHFLPLLLVAGLSVPALLHAQLLTDLSRRQLRWDCEDAVNTLKQGWMTSSYDWAVSTVPGCGDDGIAAIAKVWRHPPRDTARLERLVVTSTQLSDQRILESVTATATDPRQPNVVRLEALRVLAFYANPALYISLGQLDPKWIMDAPGFLQRGDGFTGFEGSHPLDPEARERALETIRLIAENDKDDRVGLAAAYLATGLQSLRRPH
jgi:hypothetical protein